MEYRLATLRRLLRLHGSWLLVKLLGPDSVSKEDLADLKKYKKLPLGDEVDLIGRAFSLGRLSAISKKDVYSEVELEELSRLDKFKNSNVDKLIIREAKLHAASHMESAVANAIEKAAEKVGHSATELAEHAATRELIADEITLAVREKKSRQQLASSLGNKLRADLTKDIKRIAITEFHRTKQRGVAMAIANKVGIYKESDGTDSEVSVVPNKGACKDCKNLYLDDGGNPKVFILKDLVARGSNADPGVSHTVGADGLRTGWKAVMPPAHPHCFCELVYLPPNRVWKQGRLVSDISKAVDTGSLKPTIKPPGPKSTQGFKLPKPGNAPGVSAKPPLGASIGGSQTVPINQNEPSPPPTGQGDDQYEPCPYGGGKECISHGGNGASAHKRGGAVMQAHAEHMDASGGTAKIEGQGQQTQMPPEELASILHRNSTWSVENHPHNVTIGHLKTSEIVHTAPLGDKVGINDSVQAFTKDNGSGILKSSFDGTGLSSIHEEGGYGVFVSSGRSDLCNPTVTRLVTDEKGKSELKSFQAWADDAESVGTIYKEMHGGKRPPNFGELVNFMVEKSADKDQLLEDLSEIIVRDVVLNNTDRHYNNIMVNEEFSRAQAIDHGFSFGIGLGDYRQEFHEGFNSTNRKVKITTETRSWLENVSLSDMRRATGGVEEWRAAQSYLRAKYALHIADMFGHLDISEIQNETFERFALDFIDRNASQPDSPEYEAANELLDMGVFMDPEQNKWGRGNSGPMRSRGDQYSYEMYIRSRTYMRDHATPEERRKLANRMAELSTEASNEFQEPIRLVNKDLDRLQRENAEIKKKRYQLYQKVDRFRSAVLQDNAYDPEKQREIEEQFEDHKEDVLNLRDLDARLTNNNLEMDKKERLLEYTKKAQSRAKEAAGRQAYLEFVPPGQEARFKELQARLFNAQANPTANKPKSKPDYSKVRPKKETNTAASIEQRKRGML